MGHTFLPLDKAVELVLNAAKQHAHALDSRFEDWEAGDIRDAIGTVEDFFVNNVFDGTEDNLKEIDISDIE